MAFSDRTLTQKLTSIHQTTNRPTRLFLMNKRKRRSSCDFDILHCQPTEAATTTAAAAAATAAAAAAAASTTFGPIPLPASTPALPAAKRRARNHPPPVQSPPLQSHRWQPGAHIMHSEQPAATDKAQALPMSSRMSGTPYLRVSTNSKFKQQTAPLLQRASPTLPPPLPAHAHAHAPRRADPHSGDWPNLSARAHGRVPEGCARMHLKQTSGQRLRQMKTKTNHRLCEGSRQSLHPTSREETLRQQEREHRKALQLVESRRAISRLAKDRGIEEVDASRIVDLTVEGITSEELKFASPSDDHDEFVSDSDSDNFASSPDSHPSPNRASHAHSRHRRSDVALNERQDDSSKQRKADDIIVLSSEDDEPCGKQSILKKKRQRGPNLIHVPVSSVLFQPDVSKKIPLPLHKVHQESSSSNKHELRSRKTRNANIKKKDEHILKHAKAGTSSESFARLQINRDKHDEVLIVKEDIVNNDDEPPIRRRRPLPMVKTRLNDCSERLRQTLDKPMGGMKKPEGTSPDNPHASVLLKYGNEKRNLVREIERRECSSSQKKRVMLSRVKKGPSYIELDKDEVNSGMAGDDAAEEIIAVVKSKVRVENVGTEDSEEEAVVPFIENIRLRPVNAAEQREINRVTRNVRKKGVLATVKEANILLRGEDFSCLRGSRWLNDEVMNAFVGLINARNVNHFVKRMTHVRHDDDGVGRLVREVGDESYDTFFRLARPRTHVFNTFFMARLGSLTKYDYNGVRRWLKRAGKNVATLDLILVPINLSNFHWVLVGIDIRNHHFLYLDSMLGRDCDEAIEVLKKWLYDEVVDKINEETAKKMNINHWRCVINPTYLPQQGDGGSCGVFSLYLAEYLERGERPDFTQKDIFTMRQRTVLFLKGGYLPTS